MAPPFLTGQSIPDWPNEVFSEYGGLLGDQPGCMLRSGPWKLNYYSESDSCQLFNIDDDPGERNDRADDPACKDIVAEALANIHARWSAQNVLDNLARQERARRVIQASGHAIVPHEEPVFAVPDGSNTFDFSQLPQKPSWSPFD